MKKLLAALAMVSALVTHAYADSSEFALTVRIHGSPGGVISEFVHRYIQWRNTGAHIIVDGECHSACTLFLGIFPPDRYCVTPKAVLGFHTASFPDPQLGPFLMRHSVAGTEFIWSLYPEEIRAKLRLKGWNGDDPTQPHPDIIRLEGSDLYGVINMCPVKDWNMFKSDLSETS